MAGDHISPRKTAKSNNIGVLKTYVEYESVILQRKLRKEITFSHQIEEARKFSAEDYVKQYLHEFNTELVPGTTLNSQGQPQ